MRKKTVFLACFLGLLIAVAFRIACAQASHLIPPLPQVTILVDDFQPQPLQGDSIYYYNRLEGDRGALNDGILLWGKGLVTVTVAPGNTWAGLWTSLNHPGREGLGLNFSALLPSQVKAAYQSQVTGLTVQIAGGTPGKTFRLELKEGSVLRWSYSAMLSGSPQTISQPLPPLGNITQLVWVLDGASPGDFVVVQRISLSAITQTSDPAANAFVWSYGMLLNNWNASTGLVRDKARDASGEFDAIQATGSLALATALAEQVGVIDRAAAIQVVDTISDTLLLDVPRYHGLWPHWVTLSPTGSVTIKPGTEWSSVDSVIAAIALLDAQSALGLDTSGTENMLKAIDWSNLVMPAGIAHGYSEPGALLPYTWDTFGGESWLVDLAYASAAGQVAPLAYPAPPTANGSGFIDELAWLFTLPPAVTDTWGNAWDQYRASAANTQIDYYPTHSADSCLSKALLFGLSAAEVPVPSKVPPSSIYQAFGVGGRFALPNDGSALLGAPVAVPHYSALLASLHPQEASLMWGWLIQNGFFSPLNNVESLIFPAGSGCAAENVEWNSLKGSWNLALQTLGWGRYLAERDGKIPAGWQATLVNPFLRGGYLVLAPGGVRIIYLPGVVR